MNGNWLVGCHSSKELPFGTPKDAFQGRVHGDSLVGILRRNYNTTPGCDLHIAFLSINEGAEIRDRRNRAKTNKKSLTTPTPTRLTPTPAGGHVTEHRNAL